MARGMSVHVGLNEVDPDHYDGWDGALVACENDANDMEAIAKSRGFETSKFLTRDATSDAVIQAIQKAADELESGSSFFISYSGHGGQVPDGTDEEVDRSDETWLAYDRQVVDDELFELWTRFKPGVRITVLSDSCHSGSVNKGINEAVPNPVKTAEEAARHSPRYRALPFDKMVATYRSNKALYDEIQKRTPGSKASEQQLGATVFLISGCQDDQLSKDGFTNGAFTEQLLKVWDDGAWQGGYRAFHEAILSRMPKDDEQPQEPNFNPIGPENPTFEQQDPFTV